MPLSELDKQLLYGEPPEEEVPAEAPTWWGKAWDTVTEIPSTAVENLRKFNELAGEVLPPAPKPEDMAVAFARLLPEQQDLPDWPELSVGQKALVLGQVASIIPVALAGIQAGMTGWEAIKGAWRTHRIKAGKFYTPTTRAEVLREAGKKVEITRGFAVKEPEIRLKPVKPAVGAPSVAREFATIKPAIYKTAQKTLQFKDTIYKQLYDLVSKYKPTPTPADMEPFHKTVDTFIGTPLKGLVSQEYGDITYNQINKVLPLMINQLITSGKATPQIAREVVTPEKEIVDTEMRRKLTLTPEEYAALEKKPELSKLDRELLGVPEVAPREDLALAMRDTKTGEIITATPDEKIHTDMMARLQERYKEMEPGWVDSKGKFYDVLSGRRTLAGFEPTKEAKPPTKPPIPPTPPPTGMPQEPERDPLIKLTELIKQAKPIRAKIETQYTKERGRRFADVDAFIDKNVDEVGGEEGYGIIFSKMKGPLIPEEERKKLKIDFEPVKDKLNDGELKALFMRTWKHPYLSTGEKLSAGNALMDLFEGEIPQPKQLVLLEEIYGSEFIKAVLKKRAWGVKAKEFVIEVANIPRVALSTADMSGVLRQNVIFMVAEPTISAKATAKAFQAAFRPKIAEQYFDDLRKAEDYNFMKKMGVSITDPTRATLVEREEAFISRFLQKVPIVKEPVGFAERGYTTLLSKVRVDVFRKWAEELKSQGLDPVKDEDVFRAAADVVNTFSGRGSLGKAGNRIRPQLNTLLYSPGLIAARFNALNLLWYMRQPKPVRKKAIGAFAKFVAAGLTTLALIKVMADDEVEVEVDPRSADFGKIKVGNTRYDIWGGHQQFARVFAQIIMGERKSTTTGEIISLNKDEYPFTTRWETALRFMEGKFAPTPALVKELMQGARTFKGEKMTVSSVAFEKFTPMWIQDVAEVYAEGGFEATLLPGAAAFMGVGVQTYAPRKKKKKRVTY